MLRSAAVILSGNAITSLFLLARNLIVARLIPVEDYGIAATFAVSMAIVEMLSALGLQQQIIRDENGEDPHLQAALQGFQLLRGVLSAAALFALAGPLAGFMGIPQAGWAYQLLALVPVLNALVHFDVYRLNRQMRFGPMMMTGVAPAFASLVAIWPLAVWMADYRVLLYAILLQAVLTTVTSHLMAERPYRLVLDRAIIAQSLKFGWPILVNGALLFVVFNADKLIVGRYLGMAPLAMFAMGLTLTLTPTLVFEKSAQSLMLPLLTRARGDAAQFRQLSLVTFQLHLALGLAVVLGILWLAGPVILWILGAKYAALIPLMPALAVQQAVRLFRGGNSATSLALAMTSNSMWGSLPRVLSLPLIIGAAAQGVGLSGLIWIGIGAEAAGFFLALWLSQRRLDLPLRPMLLPVALTLVVLGLALLPSPWAHLAATVLAGAAIWTMRDLVGFIHQFRQKR